MPCLSKRDRSLPFAFARPNRTVAPFQVMISRYAQSLEVFHVIRYPQLLFPLPAFLVVILLFTGFAVAQNFRGGINGTVTDQGGASISGAHVEITEDATGVAHSSVSSSAGDFSFPDLPLGLYTVTATSSSFETLKVAKVQLSAGTIYSLALKLGVASQAITVEVNTAGGALETTSTMQTTVVPTRTIQDTPMNGRDFAQFMQLTPGFAGYSAGGGAGTASLNATRSNEVNWQIEGTDNNDLWWNSGLSATNNGFDPVGVTVGWAVEVCRRERAKSRLLLCGWSASRTLAHPRIPSRTNGMPDFRLAGFPSTWTVS
jgi:Carboxypeptidase regulatory-like domain